jgi:UDP-3-O-acyl N-acetylglucosamine deacetylase
VKIHNYRRQRTLRRAVELAGIGFLTGAQIRVRFQPAPPSSGVVFVRTDLCPAVCLPAEINHVSGTARRTTLGEPPATVGLVEHALAALAGLRIDNCRVELDGPELPGLDGSALGFVEALHEAGAQMQFAWRPILTVDQPVVVAGRDATLTLHPSKEEGLRISYFLDYGPFSPLGRQTHSEYITPETFSAELANCRTFLLEAEAVELRRQGVGRRTTTQDLLIFGPKGPIDNRLRFANEPARHKVLDLVGDLSLLGADLQGHVVAYRSGHPLNVELVRVLSRCQVRPNGGVRQAA